MNDDRVQKAHAPAPFSILPAGLTYFSLVFTVGFLMGIIREFWLIPRLGVRYAELAVHLLMLAVFAGMPAIFARWENSRHNER